MTQVIDVESDLEAIIDTPLVKMHLSSTAGDSGTAIRDLARKLSAANSRLSSSREGLLGNPISEEYAITYGLESDSQKKYTSRFGFSTIEKRARSELTGPQLSNRSYRARKTFEVTPAQRAAANTPLSAYAGKKFMKTE